LGAKELGTTADLRYLEADNVNCPSGNLAEFRVVTADAKALGNVSGVLISPTTRRCEYFVIESPGLFSHRRFLLPVDAGAVLEDGPKSLRLTARKDELDLQAFTLASVPQFSDEDLLTAMFSRDAA
jgi:PRC-barrel domain